MYKKIIISLSLIIALSINRVPAKDYEAIKLEDLRIESPAKKPDKSKQIEKLSSSLERIYKLYIENKDYSKFAKQSKLKLIDDRVVVTILPRHGILTAYIDENNLKSFGVKIQAKAKHSMRVEIPVSQLKNVATKIDGIGKITRPIKPIEHAITSEGVNLMNADAWHSSGHDGTGVKIAVIDGGFDTLTQAQANGDIPSSYKSYDFTGNGLETESHHGTAVSEAIFDLVPQAQFHLYKIGDGTDFENAIDSCISNNVDIVNHSMGWFNTGGYYDGTGFICNLVDDAISNGILWVNSAGNSAEDHYRAMFRDTIITDGFHDFSRAGGNINPIGPDSAHVWYHDAGEYITITLNWDEYPYTNQDYDLYLAQYTGSWTIVDSSVDRQTGIPSSYPEELIVYQNTVSNGMYGVAVAKYSATNETVDFTLFDLDRSFGYHTDSSSLTDPGTVTDVLTVGAIDRNNYTSGPQEDFSSQGPTTDGRTKPDVAAPDNCNSFAYGYWYGTSLSSPHTAGVCALIKSLYPGYSNSDIQNYLYTNCTSDLGTAGKDNIYGWGKVLMPDIAEIAVTSPNGSEDWQVASNHDITWTSSNTSGAVQIEYSTNNGSSWSDIITSIPDTGAYSWTIPDTPSDSCLVRITDTIGTSPSDTSDAMFKISPIPFITITSPDGGEDWQVDSSHDITWTSSNTSRGVKIEYSTNNGSSWSDIITSIPDTGAYSWTIPDTSSDSCLVRITDTTGSPADTSNSIFSISSPSAIPFSKLPRTYSMDVKAITAGNQFEIKYELPEEADIGFLLYDIKGTKIKEFSEKHTAGYYSKNVDMRDVPAGVYFIRMKANTGSFTDTRKVILVR